jgi:hypothetical protein
MGGKSKIIKSAPFGLRAESIIDNQLQIIR